MSAGGYFTYAGRSSRDFGILVDKAVGIWDSPDRDCSSVEIPGRNGELTIDNGRWKNVPGRYECGIGVNFQTHFEDFRAFFAKIRGYNRLEDSWHSEEFRLARPSGNLSAELFKNGLTGEFAVEFSVMPQRFLKSGENSRSLSTGTNTIYNPTQYDAAPVLTVTGSGTIQIGSESMIVSTHSGQMVIDLETGDAYSATGHVNYNQFLTYSGNIPSLVPGNNNIVIPSGMTATIKPKWWTL